MKKLFFFLFLLLNISTFAQTYPVQIVAVMTPPHSSKIADYANPMGNRIHLQLITTDLSVQNRAITLHLEIKGNGISAVSAPLSTGIPNLRISGGEILSLTHSELAHYFQLRNLQGITTEQYASVLPDGVYSFCFRVKDATSGQWLSQNQCTMAYLMLNDPPLLNIPSDNEQVQVSDFQNILFSWTPRQINAVNVAYAFELREILDPNLDPKFAFEVSRKVHFEENLRTTTFVYDVSKPNLVPGRRYAWRIKAASTGGLAENSVFKNNGYSEIRSFVYAVNCSKPAFLLSQQQGKTSVKLLWQGNTSHQKYHIQYRKKGVENAQWFESFTRNTQTIIANLQSGAEYEFRVGASCEAERYGTTPSFAYADIQTFSIEKQEKSNENSYNCGIVPKIEITNQKPLASLIANEVFTAGDFPVQVLETQGSNGVFSGKGFIKVPYLNDTKLSVSFENVKINTDNQLIEGIVKTEYDPSWGNVTDPTEDIKAIIEIGKKISDIIQNAISKGSISEQEFQSLVLENTNFEEKINEKIDFLSPILDEKEVEIYQKEIKELKKHLKESRCSVQENENFAYHYPNRGYGMSFNEDFFDFYQAADSEKCLEKLQKYDELSKKISQKLEKDQTLYKELEEIWEFLKGCYDTYKDHKGFVPRCLWDHDNYVPNGIFVPYINDPAFISGIIDGGAEIIEMAIDVVDVSGCFNPISFRFWLERCKVKREETINTLKSLRELLKTETLKQIFEEFKEYVSETAGFDKQARYNQGKLLFDVVAAYFGASQIKAVLKGASVTTVVTQTLKEIPKDAIKIVTSTKNITKKTAEEIVEGVKINKQILDNIFKGSRQKAIAKFGKEAEDLIYIKFNNDGGAAAEIMTHYGEEGFKALKKVNNIDDVVGELIKGKTAYRHISSNVKYLEELKSTGKIPKNLNQTYFSLDKIDNPKVAIDKMQLNAELTDAVWRLEFEANQLIGKAKFPKAKWNNAEYIEVLTRSYPNFGSGGATQFITQSEIKLTKMTNLKTGEIIKFK